VSTSAGGQRRAESPDIISAAGILDVRFSYQHSFDAANRELFCFMTPDGWQNPTLHVNPGDRLIIPVTNNLPAGSDPMVLNAPTCGASVMNNTSVNIHYHGTNTSPTCHQDDVIKTIVNAGDANRSRVGREPAVHRYRRLFSAAAFAPARQTVLCAKQHGRPRRGRPRSSTHHPTKSFNADHTKFWTLITTFGG
jgi:hypothetical protein